MKKNKKITGHGNVIYFPNLDKRLFEKGINHLHNCEYDEAIESLEEARKIDGENEDILIGLILAYYEKGFYKEAKQLVTDMLKKGIGDYLETMDLYLMILIQLHEYEEVASTIEALLEEMKLPVNKFEHFSKLLSFSKKMIEEKHTFTDDHLLKNDVLHDEEEAAKEFSLFETDRLNEIIYKIGTLANRNIRPYIDEMKEYLIYKEGHPFVKTLIINLLKEHEYEREVAVEKFGKRESFIPNHLSFPNEMKQRYEIEKELMNMLEHDDPILLNQAVELLERQLFFLYPFQLEPNSSRLWAVAYFLTVASYHGKDLSSSSVAEQFNVLEDEVIEACSFIRMLEEISFPVL